VPRVPFACITALLLLACGRDRGTAREGASVAAAGPDPVVVRLPRQGGVARAYAFAALDSSIWRAAQATPAIARILAFDSENGLLAFVDTGGFPGWIDLRLGSVRRPARHVLTTLTSADGWAVYGVSSGNVIVRMTPSGDWQLPASRSVRWILPTPDGTVLVVTDAGKGRAMLLRMRPPDEAVTDSVAIPAAAHAAVTPVGDRVYLGAADRLLSVAPNEVTGVEDFGADGDIVAIAPTPSGDRVFLAGRGAPRLERFDRYDAGLSGSVVLPGPVVDLRMDPLGRYLLARPEKADSAWVVSLGTEELVGSVGTQWRADLPAVALDGTIATLRGDDVVFLEPRANAPARTVTRGARDIWFFARWNGFRPRARGIDEPVSFRFGSESARTAAVVPGSTATPPPGVVADTAARPPVVAPAEPTVAPPPRAGWTVSYAAVLSLERARDIAAGITVLGERARIVTGETGGTTVYRVVMGPYQSRDAAERIGKASGHSYWVYEGVP
jgi:cell division septation protein DedD